MPNDAIKNELFMLADTILTCAPDWEDRKIVPNMMRACSMICPAQDGLMITVIVSKVS